MSGKLSHFIHVAPGNTTQGCLPRVRKKKVHERWGEGDTWTCGTDVLQLNKGQDYKHLYTHTPPGQTSSHGYGKGACAHTHKLTPVHSTNKPQ